MCLILHLFGYVCRHADGADRFPAPIAEWCKMTFEDATFVVHGGKKFLFCHCLPGVGHNFRMIRKDIG